jgi:cation diffusion facilitator family transporter
MSTASKKVIYAALAGNTLITITKFIATTYTGSSAMLSETIHSLVDTGNQVLLLYGINRSKKPATEQFPFGHGKEIYFWSFIVAILIFAVGAGISIYEGIHSLLNPTPIRDIHINYIVLFLAMAFEGAAWYYALQEFSRAKGKWGYIEAVKRGKDPSMFMVLFEDSAALLGLLVAFFSLVLGQITGELYWDGIASIIIGLILAGTAIWLAYETKSLLIGESANKEVISGIRKCAQSHAIVNNVNEVLTMHMGPDFVLANISIEFADSAITGEIETTISAIDRQLKQQFPILKRIFVEAEAGSAT